MERRPAPAWTGPAFLLAFAWFFIANWPADQGWRHFILTIGIITFTFQCTASLLQPVIGFAAETENVIEHARKKLKSKGADWIVANDVSGDVMGGDANQIHLITADGVESWERPKPLA